MLPIVAASTAFLSEGQVNWRLKEAGLIVSDVMFGIWGLFGILYFVQCYQSWKVNQEAVSGKKPNKKSDRHAMSQVFLLGLAYIASFGSELAVVSMLPTFFTSTFGLDYTQAGLSAACYPLINLFGHPVGGWICDNAGSRKWTLTLLLAGVGLGHLVTSQINANWSLPLAIVTLMFSAFFTCAGSGATFGIAPWVIHSSSNIWGLLLL